MNLPEKDEEEAAMLAAIENKKLLWRKDYECELVGRSQGHYSLPGKWVADALNDVRRSLWQYPALLEPLTQIVLQVSNTPIAVSAPFSHTHEGPFHITIIPQAAKKGRKSTNVSVNVSCWCEQDEKMKELNAAQLSK